jgi:hypothetical protein
MSALTQPHAPMNPSTQQSGFGGGLLPALVRLLRLHLISRRVPVALITLAGCGVLMQWAVRSALSQNHTSGARTSAEQLGLLLEAAAAAVVSAAMHGPFGEPERATGHRLHWLRLASALLLTGVALGAVAAGVAGTAIPVGSLAVARDTAGMIGVGLLCAVVVGGHFAWVGPTSYFVIAAYAVADKWASPWTWPARPGHDVGGAVCALSLLTAGIIAITVLGPRERAKD